MPGGHHQPWSVGPGSYTDYAPDMIQVAVLDSAGEFNALGEELVSLNPEISLSNVARGPGGWDRPTGADVVLIAASSDGVRDLVSAASAAHGAGLPCVALLPVPGLFDLDLAGGVVELCFPPFTAEEIEVRIIAALQRAGGPKNANRVDAGELSIDLERYEVTVSGNRIDLTYKEYELLRVLASNPGRVFSREALLKEVWDYDYFGGTRTVDVHVRRVRAKTNDARHRFIETVRNVGYRFRTPS